jgi:uncharacterized protein
MTAGETILWRRRDQPGHESARLYSVNSNWHLDGTAVFEYNRRACRLDYLIECDPEWRTSSGKITGWVGDDVISIEIFVDETGRWRLNDEECAEVAGCIDLDLNFSPVTNLLPIRRLNIDVGEEASMRAAWLRFPSFKLEPLEQIYRRLSLSTYRYESAGGRFVTDLKVNEAGFVTLYPNFWEAEGEA